MRCDKCKREVDAVFRANEKGVAGIWHCRECHVLPIDVMVDEIVSIIEKDNRK